MCNSHAKPDGWKHRFFRRSGWLKTTQCIKCIRSVVADPDVEPQISELP